MVYLFQFVAIITGIAVFAIMGTYTLQPTADALLSPPVEETSTLLTRLSNIDKVRPTEIDAPTVRHFVVFDSYPISESVSLAIGRKFDNHDAWANAQPTSEWCYLERYLDSGQLVNLSIAGFQNHQRVVPDITDSDLKRTEFSALQVSTARSKCWFFGELANNGKPIVPEVESSQGTNT